jgi:hypothetical protein
MVRHDSAGFDMIQHESTTAKTGRNRQYPAESGNYRQRILNFTSRLLALINKNDSYDEHNHHQTVQA